MASASGLPFKSIAFTMAIAATASASRVNIEKLIVETFTGPGKYSRIAALVLLLVNVKNIPGVWHYRVWNGILSHLVFNKPRIPASLGPASIFLPLITTSHAALLECDYNLHKSNSTYFSDLDISRTHLVCCLLQPGIDALKANKTTKLVLDKEGKAVKGRWGIMLGGVTCSFKREIAIGEGYEMWSRVLCWDRKWLFMVTHFVKKGVVRPRGFVLSDGGWFGGGRNARFEEREGEGEGVLDEKFIFATALSKYVTKLGRLTIHPEVVLGASGLLPERPGGWHSMANSGESTPELLNGDGEAEIADVGAAGKKGANEWDWKRVDAENKRGLEYADHFAALDELHTEFSGTTTPALGKYRDLL